MNGANKCYIFFIIKEMKLHYSLINTLYLLKYERDEKINGKRKKIDTKWKVNTKFEHCVTK